MQRSAATATGRDVRFIFWCTALTRPAMLCLNQGRCKTCQAQVKLQRKGEKPETGARAAAAPQVSIKRIPHLGTQAAPWLVWIRAAHDLVTPRPRPCNPEASSLLDELHVTVRAAAP